MATTESRRRREASVSDTEHSENGRNEEVGVLIKESGANSTW